MLNSPVTFTSTVSTDKCADPLIYLWEFGDGTTSSQQNPSHTYTTKGTYTWKFSVSSGIISCEKSGTIYIDTERPCVQIGDLKFCADLVQQIDDKTSGLLGNVTLNDKLFFNGYVTVVKTSNTTGTLAINEGIYVKQIHGSDENVITGSAKFYVDGIDKALTQYEGPLMYSLNLLNLPLEIEGSEIKIEDDGIVVTPFLNLGVEPVILCRVQMSILLVPNDDKYILSVEVVNGQLTPSISVSSFSITYNPDDQEITGSASIGLPFLEIASLDASVQFKPGCLDGFSITIGLPTGIPLGTTGLEIDALTLEIDNICTPARFYIFLGGDLAVAGVPSEVVVWEHLGLGYQVPFTLQIDGGSVAFLGYPLASTGGTITVYPPYASVYGQASIANVLVARISITLDISNLLISGNASGSFQIPNWDCCSVCLICKATRALVRNIFGTLPYVLAGVDMGVAVGQIEEGRWGGYLRGMLTFNNKSIAAEIKFDNGDISLLLGTNYDNLFEIWLAQEKALSPLGYEKSLNIAEDQERVVFSAAGVSALPEIYLVTPDGSRLTKENYTSYPGALYYESSEDNACFFEITSVSKGVWAFGMSNLNQGDGELFALCAHKKPEIEFESVSPSVKGYAVNLKVAPASADTKVSLFYTNSPDYANGLAIAKDLTSESGNYSISWDTSKVSNGSYLLFAKADDGKNPEEIAYYPNQITINKDGINPPTNLSGTRNGETANLTWTPSTSQNIAGYDILYTD
ncbi:MAG: PKD domain-containing protein, partial [Acidobacteria bacterium]|nr:PKD domain-containing protein [Acidobacteriota bacterium]